jgi:hypothetical protein
MMSLKCHDHAVVFLCIRRPAEITLVLLPRTACTVSAPPLRTFTQSFDLAFEVLTLNQIGDFVIVVLAALFLLPPFLLLQALVTLR